MKKIEKWGTKSLKELVEIYSTDFYQDIQNKLTLFIKKNKAKKFAKDFYPFIEQNLKDILTLDIVGITDILINKINPILFKNKSIITDDFHKNLVNTLIKKINDNKVIDIINENIDIIENEILIKKIEIEQINNEINNINIQLETRFPKNTIPKKPEVKKQLQKKKVENSADIKNVDKKQKSILFFKLCIETINKLTCSKNIKDISIIFDRNFEESVISYSLKDVLGEKISCFKDIYSKKTKSTAYIKVLNKIKILLINKENISKNKNKEIFYNFIESLSPYNKFMKDILNEVFIYDKKQTDIKKIITDNQKTLLVCPYCNIDYIAVTKSIIAKNVKGEQKIEEKPHYLFVLDHFYDKATHPYFALSFYNLVPCCHTCNSSFKGSKDFSIKTHLHPYTHDFDSIARFSLPLTKENLQQFLVPNSSIKVEDTDTEEQKEAKKLKIEIKSAKKASEEDFERAKNNVKDFLLDKRYELHQDYINEILIKAYAYPDDYLDSIQKTFPKLFEGAGSTEQMKRLIWGNYTQAEDINRRPLAKLTQDIMNELGLNK